MQITVQPNINNISPKLETSDTPSGEGRTAYVYFTTDDQYAIKVYKCSTQDDYMRLEQIIISGKNLGEDKRYTAWPLAIVTACGNKPCIGVVTRKAPGDQLDGVAFIPYYANQQFIKGYSWLNYIKMARAVAAATRSVHERGMAHGDISMKNVLGIVKSGEATLIDLDGIIVPGFLHPQVAGTDGFMAPEINKEIATDLKAKREGKTHHHKISPSIDTDIHSLAVLVLWLLLFRNVMQPTICYDEENRKLDDALGFGEFACFSEHPKDKRNWFKEIGAPFNYGGYPSYKILTLHLQELTDRALVQGLNNPKNRPAAREWENAIAESYDVLVPCRECKQIFMYPYYLEAKDRKCPFCDTKYEPPYPVVLQLLEHWAHGQFSPIRLMNDGQYTPVVLYAGAQLFQDVTEKGKIPPFTRKDTPRVGIVGWDSQNRIHHLKNDSDQKWKIIVGRNSGQAITRGDSVPLEKGVILSFGDGHRLAKVVE